MKCEEAEGSIDAYLDGELDAGARAALETHLSACADCAGRRRELAALSSALRAQAPYHRAPAGLRATVRRALRGGAARGPVAWRARVAPGLTGVALGFACAVLLSRPGLPGPSEVVAAHSRALLADRLVEVRSSDHHQVKPWFSRHVDFSPPLPDLAAEGFPLTGGRAERLADGPAAVLVYERRRHAIDVFVRPAAGPDAGPRPSEERGFHVVSWRAGGFSFQAVSDLNAEELARFAGLLRAGAP